MTYMREECSRLTVHIMSTRYVNILIFMELRTYRVTIATLYCNQIKITRD